MKDNKPRRETRSSLKNRVTRNIALEDILPIPAIELDKDKYTKYFLRHLATQDVENGSEVLAAELATNISRYDFAIQIAKLASYEKRFHNTFNYPIISTPNLVNGRKIPEQSFILSIIRQESEFDIKANSSAGARGLMQLMTYTAKLVAKQAKLSYSKSKLKNPEYNIKLGSYYLAGLLEEYEGSYGVGSFFNPNAVAMTTRRNYNEF